MDEIPKNNEHISHFVGRRRLRILRRMCTMRLSGRSWGENKKKVGIAERTKHVEREAT